MATPSEIEQQVLEGLRMAVLRELDRKRRLGQHAIVWQDGRVVRLGPEELPVLEDYESGKESGPGNSSAPNPEKK